MPFCICSGPEEDAGRFLNLEHVWLFCLAPVLPVCLTTTTAAAAAAAAVVELSLGRVEYVPGIGDALMDIQSRHVVYHTCL
jgi:hypothetical protein